MNNLITSFLFVIIFTVILGLAYPLAVWVTAQVLFPFQAYGSLIKNSDGVIIGSELIGQQFSGKKYFHSRPSSAGNSYDATASGGSNLAPTSARLIERVNGDVEKLIEDNLGAKIPADLLTTSASGLDPHISPAAAEYQIPRIARERQISEEKVRELVTRYTEGRQFGILGERRVNVLKINLALDEIDR
jgi:K+-transporting ATPase ATPase C chain